MTTKQILRKEILAQRQRLTPLTCAIASQSISQYIFKLAIYKNAKSIALYQPFQNEIDITSLLTNSKHTFCFPIIQPLYQLKFIKTNKYSQWHHNRYGILEPLDSSTLILPEEIDLMILPLVAFDISGNRLGMGKGYYDRTLANGRPKHLIGVAYEFQKKSHIPTDVWDILVDEIITEKNHYFCKEQLCQPITG